MIGIIHLIVDYCLGSSELCHLRPASALSYQCIWWRAGFLDMVYEVPPQSLMLMRVDHDVSHRWDLLSVWICLGPQLSIPTPWENPRVITSQNRRGWCVGVR